MKHNYTFLHRPAWLCLALIWLAFQADFAFAQTRAIGTPVSPGGSAFSNKVIQSAPVRPLAGAQISVSPQAVTDTLNTGRKSTQYVTVQNTGTDTLKFAAGAVPTFTTRKDTTKVLILTREYFSEQVLLFFANIPDFDVDVYPNTEINALTLAHLLPYDVVFIYNAYPFDWVDGREDGLGDLLADYVDAGGNIILNALTFEDNIIGIRGRIEQYSPFLPTSEYTVTDSTTRLGTVLKPDHPFMRNVGPIEVLSYPAKITLAPGATDIAHWNTGDVMVATTPHIAAVNVMPTFSGFELPVPWSGDLDSLYINIVRFFKAQSVMKVSPPHGAIVPGGQITLNVDFDATLLDSANYVAALEISSNAADTLVTIPMTLVVKGKDILFHPDTLTAALHPDESAVHTLTVANNGTETHTFTVTGAPPYATVSPTSGTLAPGETAALSVNFSAASLTYGTYPGEISFLIDTTIWKAPVSLYVYDVPVMEVSTTLVSDTIDYRAESVKTFQIHNTGGSDLMYELYVNDGGASASTQQSLVVGTTLLHEDFEGPVFPPVGWATSAGTAPDPNDTWHWHIDFYRNQMAYWGNYAGTGRAAMIGESNTRRIPTDATLTTPEISATGYRDFVLQYNANFQENAFTDTLLVELQVDGGPWRPILKWADEPWGTHGPYMALPGEAVSLPLGDHIDSTATSFRVRWHYTVYFAVEMNWYGQLDDIVILGEKRSWINVTPLSGAIPVGGTADIQVNFDANDHGPGTYTGAIQIASNDPETPDATVQAILTVNGNVAPVLASIDTVEVTQYSQQTVVFTATDADNDSVTITLKNAPAFVTLVTTGNGSASYKIAPGASIGEYDLRVVAVDSRGAADSAEFHLSVLEYGAARFYFQNIVTGETYPAFTDSVNIDITAVDFNALRLYAETNPPQVGSVKFRWDNSVANVTNTAPYLMNPNILRSARAGKHVAKAEVYRQPNGRGPIIKSTEAVVRLVNPSAITSFDVISSLTTVLFPLPDNTIIDLSQNNLPKVTIRANISGTGVKSVVFKLNGRVRAAINLPGHGVYYIHVPATLGTYTLEATPYSAANSLGIAGTPLTVHFQIINGAQAAARRAGEADILPEESDDARFAVYPVPVADVLHINLSDNEKGHIRLLIHDAQGRALYVEEGDAATFDKRTISTVQAGFTRGVYYVQVQYADGRREIRKFIKE